MSTVAPVPQHWIPASAEILTVGLPFCVFKLLTGLVLLQTPLAPLAYALLGLGAIDLLINVFNLLSLLAQHRRVAGVCLADVAWRRFGGASRRDVGLAFDVFFSFALVAIVIGVGALRSMPSWALPMWNIAVVLNVLGAGVGRLFSALRR